jgi:hypothetical protein
MGIRVEVPQHALLTHTQLHNRQQQLNLLKIYPVQKVVYIDPLIGSSHQSITGIRLYPGNHKIKSLST